MSSKGKQTVEVGMASFEHKLPADTSEADLLALIDRLNADPAVHGILCSCPCRSISTPDLVIAIDPAKDVDGFHISNVGLLGTGRKAHGALHAAGLPDDAARPSRGACRGWRRW
jgi:methylenetetrahydrofolate dehydrogenase (NADP+)/methenyltetrahydrofolate cyclohydrolase